MRKTGWVSPKGEIIPVIPPKTYETTIIEWALKHNIEFDTNKNPYNSFIELGYIWFLGSSVVTQEELNFIIKRKIEDYTGEKISPQNILIFNTQETKKERKNKKMKIREDVQFTYEEDNKPKIISANLAPNFFFLHPKRGKLEIEKLTDYCPEFYEYNNRITFEKNGKIRILDRNFYLITDDIYEQFNGKIIVRKANKKSHIEDIDGNILFSNVEQEKKEKQYSIYKNAEFKIIITKQGHFTVSPLNASIENIAPCFVEKTIQENQKEIYKAFNSYCQVVLADSKWEDILNKLKELNLNKNDTYKNPLNTQRWKLYQKYLSILLAQYFKLPNGAEENYLQSLPLTLLINASNNNYVIDLENDQIIEGSFHECIEIRNENTSIWINNIDDLEEATKEYKLSRTK